MTTLASVIQRLALFCLPSTFLLTQLATAQTPVARELLPPVLGDWRAVGEVRRVDGDHLADILEADAAVYKEYGLHAGSTREFVSGKTRIAVTIYEMLHPGGAFGLRTFERHVGRSHNEAFTSGSYYITISDLTGRGIDPSGLNPLHDRFRSDPT